MQLHQLPHRHGNGMPGRVCQLLAHVSSRVRARMLQFGQQSEGDCDALRDMGTGVCYVITGI